jgi:hypothetical protein
MFWRKLYQNFLDLYYELLEVDFKDKRYVRWTISLFAFHSLAVVLPVMFLGGLPGLDFGPSFRLIENFAPVWLPILLLVIFVHYWNHYTILDFIAKESSVLLEIKVPKETNKSPLAMEIFFIALWQKGSVSLVQAYFQGKIRPWFSLELVSLEGKVKFFIWAPRKWRNLVEAQLYAQYPGIEIFEVPDYTASVKHDPENLPLWATYFKLTDPDVYPIKTYVDYGLDKLEMKEEFRIDPMTSVLEYLGSLGKGEQAWIQILIQAHIEKGLKQRHLIPRGDWKREIDEEVEKIRKEATPPQPKDSKFPGFPNPTPGQVEKIKALEKSKGKFPFETAIRGFYIATKESFNPINITGLIGSFRQYSSNNLNGFKLGWFTDFDYPWQDFKRIRRDYMEQEMLKAYKLRSFFNPPYENFHNKKMILMTEELATIYHFPGGVAQTPTLDRILSKKTEPPANLPI